MSSGIMPAITAKAASSSEILMFYFLHVVQTYFRAGVWFSREEETSRRPKRWETLRKYFVIRIEREINSLVVRQKKRHLERYRFTFAIGRHLRPGASLSRKYSRGRATLYLV